MKSFNKIKIVTSNSFIYTFLIIITFFANLNFAQTTNFRKIENKAFKVGEKLTFEVKYGFVTAGVAEYKIPKITKLAGRDVYQVTFD
ncbi:MAG: hypothetical protein Q8T08_22730, partial [Ignavibacteria bacterium]|nr:hypothetical protein [Ignavibacteria bacterium]